MEKSIESLWKEGFMELGQLAAPKVNNLYRQKSMLLTNRFRNTMKWDTYLVLPLGVLFLFGIGIKVHWGLGIYTFLLCVGLFLMNLRVIRRQPKSLPVDADVYQYLKTYRERIRKKIKKWTWRFALGTPVVILPAYYFIFFEINDKGHKLLETGGLGAVIGLTLFLFVVLALWGMFGYRLGVGLVYSRILRRMDHTLKDMEELSAE